MVKSWTVLMVSGLAASGGCLGAPLEESILRTQFGGNARRIAAPRPAVSRESAPIVERDAGPPLDGAYTGTMQLALRPFRYAYVGGELEAGMLSAPGSGFAAVYGVAGLEANTERTGIALELVAGRQWLRPGFFLDARAIDALEPRVRFQVLLDPQIGVGAMLGGSALSEERGWTAGLYVAVYSHRADGT